MFKKILIISFIFSVVVSCQSSNENQMPSKELRVSTPEEQGLNPQKLNELINEIRNFDDYPDLHSLLVIRNGYLVVEEYFDGYDKGDLHMLQSVSKSITSALVGIAFDRGIIENLDQKILSFFPDYKDIENLDDRKKAMTLEDILTMRTGTDYHERGWDSPHFRLNRLSSCWDIFYLNRPMISEPGTKFQYDSGGVILLSAILKNLTGMHADEFADKYLFNYLNISDLRWYKNSEGHPHTGGGLHLLPRDMAKFGLLYLNRGKLGDKQVISSKWVDESFELRVEFDNSVEDPVIGYGYLWWILKPNPNGAQKENIAAAMGAHGQYIFVIPEHDMVVVVTANTSNRTDQDKPISFLYTHILPSVEH